MSILIKLRESRNFTDSEKEIAEYILKNYNNISKISQNDIAKASYSSNSSVTRICKKLNFKGFKEFKLKLVEEISILDKEPLDLNSIDINRETNTKKIVDKLNKLSINSLKENKMLQDVKIIEKVVEEISNKKVIDFYGIGASHIVCLDAQYKFMRIGKITNTFSSVDKMYIQAKNCEQDHIAFLISYSGMTSEILKIADILKEKNITTVSITRFDDNSLIKKCDYNLFVTSMEELKRSAAIYSRIAMLNTIDIIYFKYSNDNYDYVSKKIKNTEIVK